MAKRKAKKGAAKSKSVSDPATDEKIRRLNGLLTEFRNQCSAYEKHLQTTCEEQNTKIVKLYNDKLASIPKNVQDMTIAQITEYQLKERRRNTECPKDENMIRSTFQRQRGTTEKKRTLKKDRKRSVSANTSTRPLTIHKQSTNPMPPRMSKALSESSLATPVGRFNRVSNLIVTPKFDPSVPAGKFARKPKPNEVVMSISGSPLQNFVDNTSNSKLTLSLGHVKVLTYDEEATIDQDFVKKMDEPMKQMLKDVQKKLEEILK